MMEEEEEEELRIEVEDVNDMLSDLGFKGLDFDKDIKGKKSKQMKKSGWFKGLTRKIVREIEKKKSKNVNPSTFAKDRGYIDQNHPVLLLRFLLSELQTFRMMKELSSPSPARESSIEVENKNRIQEILRRICQSVPENSIKNVCDVVSRNEKSSNSNSLLSQDQVPPEHTRILSQMNRFMREEYTTRRAMLLQRMDVTIESFMESSRVVGREKDVLDVILEPRKRMCKEPRRITVDTIFAADTKLLDSTRLRVTTNAPSSAFKSLTIGDVPDRGGRADQMRPSKNEIHGFRGRRSSSSSSSNNNSSSNKKKKRKSKSGKSRIQHGNGRTTITSTRGGGDGSGGWKKGGAGHPRRR